jgi:Holliday junction resolvasome RuvABC endonuclease subunit
MRDLVLGVDQSLSKCAFVIMDKNTEEVVDKFVVRTGNSATKQKKDVEYFKTLEEQIHHICVFLENLVVDYKPVNIIFEALSFASVGNATRNLASLAGAMKETIVCQGYLGVLEDLAPTSLKAFGRSLLPEDMQYDGMTTTGKSKLVKMDKKLMVKAVESQYGSNYLKGYNYSDGKDDIADATLLALYKVRKMNGTY